MSAVLILEDDDALRTTLARAFSRRGHLVVEANNLASLTDALKETSFDWAVVDLGLPDGSGLDAIETLTECMHGVRIAVLTGYGSISSAVEAMRRGATDYLTKPADVDQILAVLEDAPGGAQDKEHSPASLQRVEVGAYPTRSTRLRRQRDPCSRDAWHPQAYAPEKTLVPAAD